MANLKSIDMTPPSVLIVGAGPAGRLDDCGAEATLVARGQVHVMPRDVFGLKCMSQMLPKVFPTWFVDNMLVVLPWLTLGSTAKYKLLRPEEGPLTLKARTGRTPVLNVGTVRRIKSGKIKVKYSLKSWTNTPRSKHVKAVCDAT